MDSPTQNIFDQHKALTKAQKNWIIPNEVYAALENCSLQLESLFESRYERLLQNHAKITAYLRDDQLFLPSFQTEKKFLHVSLWAIDHFHVGVLGFDHIFWHMAGKYRLFGVDNSIVDHFFDPDTNQFDPELDPLPPTLFHHVDDVGNIHSSNDEFDRSNLSSTQWNFYKGLRSPRVEQRDRFRALFDRLEYDNFSFENDESEPDDFGLWTDLENEPILASLEEVKAGSGRPSDSSHDDRYALMYSKILLTRYFGKDPGKTPSRRSCILKVAEHLEIPKHNLEAFHKRIDRKLKRKMSMRNLGQ